MSNPEHSLSKVIVVTGAAKRIGRAIALRCAAEGATVAVHYRESREEAEKVASACGNGAATFGANLENVHEIVSLFETIHGHYGRIDGLVNNAARFTRVDPLAMTEQDWDFIQSVNLKATFFCSQQGARRMLPDGGHIVNISSLGGIRPWADHVHYCASKAGVIMMTRALAKAFAPAISVNSVAPGVIPFGDDASNPRIAPMIAATPMQRGGTPEEVAEAVWFYLSCSRFVTGQVTAVDGGLSQR